MKKLSVTELAKSVGVSRRTIYNLRDGIFKTENPEAAVAASKLYGGDPIDYLSDHLKNALSNPILKKILPRKS